MSNTTRSLFTLRPHAVTGSWGADHRRHAESARQLLTELETICEEVLNMWPLPHGQTVQNAETEFPELYALVRKRDRLSDSVRIFAAMAVEGFLNYYGVVRLGEEAFNTHFERMGLIPKMRALLLVCDSLSVPNSDTLVRLLEQVASGRNALVHPKTREFPGYVPAEDRSGVLIPGDARQAVETMDLFFVEFVTLIPASRHLAPPGA